MSDYASTHRYAPIQLFAFAFGVVYLVVAVAGWVLTGPSGEADILIFAVNPLHNVIHTVIAVGALAGSVTPQWSAIALTVLGAVLGLVTVLGFLGWLPMLGMHHGIAEPDNFLHLVTGAAALIEGLLHGPPEDDEELAF